MYKIDNTGFLAEGIISSSDTTGAKYRMNTYLGDVHLEYLIHQIRALLTHKEMEGQRIRIRIEAVSNLDKERG